jgi:ABC-type transport system involved in Fe-S cluster assembly fused permease/ATPase subunit
MDGVQRQEIRYRDERQHNIFTWSSSILIAVMGALIATKQSEVIIWGAYGLTGKIMASLIIAFLVFFSVQWQIRNRKYIADNDAVIQKIDYLLHYYDKGYFDPQNTESLFPEKWFQQYPTPKEKLNFWGRLKSLNYTSATFILGALTLLMIWVQ